MCWYPFYGMLEGHLCMALQGTTPVYNLLPEILSNLSSEADLPQKGFQEIMRHLLQYIGKEKHADSLVDKLCVRFEGTQELQQWRNLAFCISQVCLLSTIPISNFPAFPDDLT